MASTVNEQLVISSPATVEQAEVLEGLRIAATAHWKRLPGLVFGVMTVAYMSFAGLAL